MKLLIDTAVRSLILNLLEIISVAAVSENEIEKALALDWDDFEDSVQYSVASLGDMDGIITRNTKDYKTSELTVWTPEQLLEQIHPSSQSS